MNFSAVSIPDQKGDLGRSRVFAGFRTRSLSLLLVGICIWSQPWHLAPAAENAASPEVSGTAYDWRPTTAPERPYRHAYHQTLVMKIFLAAKEPDGGCTVHLTFEDALEVIRRLDAITLSIPKIVYLVGWQHDGHDSKYPDWSTVNPRLGRKSDGDAATSLRWLIAAAKRHHTTVSVHVNMFDAFADSPLWRDYLDKDIVAKSADGIPIPGEVHDGGGRRKPVGVESQSYQLSYTKEWETGLARRRIDALLDMLPIREAGTVHIDAFHSLRPIPHAYPQERFPNLPKSDTRISPLLDYPLEKEVATQRKIIRYWRDQGVDVTSEGAGFLRPDAFVGLQPMAWHYDPPAAGIPSSLACGTPMHAEPEIRQDPVRLPGLVRQFCTRVVPWYRANHPAEHRGDAQFFSSPRTERVGGQQVETGDDICMPALWRAKTLVAWSDKGCEARSWKIPKEWGDLSHVDVSEIRADGSSHSQRHNVHNGEVLFGIPAATGLAITAGEP